MNNNMVAFTPGPWKFLHGKRPEEIELLEVSGPYRWVFRTIQVGNDKNECLADIKAYTTEGFLQDFNQWEANAKLIVAAPDLVKALQDIIYTCGTINLSSHNQMKEAIEGAIEIAETVLDKIK